MFHQIKKKHLTVVINILIVVFLIVAALTPLASIPEKPHQRQVQTSMINYNNSISPVRKNLISSTYTVDPTEAYQNEPAPMGLADFGIENTGQSGHAYGYNTSSFLGSVNINSLSVVNNTANNTCMTFQLNLNLAFHDGTNLYVYWVQDVAYVNTSSRYIAFIDNIWNLTSSQANIHNSTLSGNGTIGNSSGTHFYYSYANNSLPGNCLSLTYPSTINFMVNSTITSNGKPQVNFMYNDGYGWIIYDSPIFTFVNNLTFDPGFVVDGYTYEPDGGSFYDAELILGGPGNGSSTVDMKSNVSLSIQYWNGHNYQEIRSAYNFGTDTAETIANVVSSGCYYKSNGTIFESISPGSGQLGQVYNSSDISTLNISMPLASGTLYINGTPERFVNDEINMTIAPGNYKMEIYNGNLLYKEFTIKLTAGEYKSIKLDQTLITFTETGLASGTEWQVNLTDHYYNSSNNSISFYEYNGNYSYTITTSNNLYIPVFSSGALNATGKPIRISVTFKELTYNATFKETGLNSGIWNIKIVEENSTVYNSGAITGQSYTFQLTNGTYHYSATSMDYKNISGEVYVNGRNTTFSLSFVFQQYNVTFIENGLPAGTSWVITLNNTEESSTSTTILFSAINGTYSYTVKSITGYKSPPSGNIKVNGNNITEEITYTHNSVKKTPFDLPGSDIYTIGLVSLIIIALGAAVIVIRRKK